MSRVGKVVCSGWRGGKMGLRLERAAMDGKLVMMMMMLVMMIIRAKMTMI